MHIQNNNPLVFVDNCFDRLALRRVDEKWITAQLSDPATRFVPVAGEDNLLTANGTPLLLDTSAVAQWRAQSQCTVLLGEYRGCVCFALGLNQDVTLPAGAARSNLRPQFGVLEDDALALLGYARAMTHWHAHNRFCGKCGAPTRSQRAGHELHCTACGNIVYPRVNPAVIMLVTHGERCLLGRQPEWAANRFSTLAGFVEPGENLENALRREILEETNVRVGRVRYLRSQPWPYPASLMLSFRAEAESAGIRCNDGELVEARWFSRQEIATGLQAGSLSLSLPGSSSHALIREWFEEVPGFVLASAADAR
ncbi:MAG: NAD(+) diphosphatase [Gammaproteobacteria bacterium]|nr:NAD(+) diphosphatase [Gammaproteobacteria bacterium]MBU6510471.1 NAD(+) diphosphatase [Gammaproteobacteria bacterium]MDE2460769.1 NAD(+) diphosphatase [Gammaproteobacteria bacterium]